MAEFGHGAALCFTAVSRALFLDCANLPYSAMGLRQGHAGEFNRNVSRGTDAFTLKSRLKLSMFNSTSQFVYVWR